MGEKETDLILAARKGDREAFGKLVTLHWSRLVRLARSVTGELTAEDAVQEGLLAAWRKLHRLQAPEAFGAWITRIVYRRCLRQCRRQRFETAVDRLPDRARHSIDGSPVAASSTAAASSAPPGGTARGTDPETGLWVQQLLAALAPRQRAVIHLTLVEGRTDSEIAGLLGITAASVRAHRRRARTRLEALMSGGDHGSGKREEPVAV